MDRDRSISLVRRFALAFYGLGIVVCIFGAMRFETNMEDVFQWLPDETPDRELYNQFVGRFGIDDFMVVTWPGCEITDSRLETFCDRLIANDERNLIEQAVSGRELLQRLVKERQRSTQSVIERFQGIYFGPDRRATCVIVMLSERGMNDRIATVSMVKKTAADSIGVNQGDLVLAGYPQVGAYGDEMVRRSIKDFVGPSCLISTLVALVCLRNFGLTLIILAVGGLAAALSVSIITLSGSKWGGLSSMIPTLSYILTVSASLHFVNYSRTRGDDRLLFRVLRIGWRPCVLSVLTTAAGMLSLCLSEFPAIREFGIYCACGLMVSLVCQLLLIPCAIDWLNPKHRHLIDEYTGSRFMDVLLPWSGTVVVLFIGSTVFASFGLMYLRSDLAVERNFSPDAPIIKDIGWLEKHIGPVEQTELLIEFPDVTAEGFAQRLQCIRAIESQLIASGQVSNVLSMAAWLPDEPSGRSLRMTAARAAYRKLIQNSREELTSTTYLDIRDNAELWRISLRFPFLESTNFRDIKTSLPNIAKATIAQHFPESNVSVRHTGVSLLYHVAQDQLVVDLYRNFVGAFVLIFPLMILVLRSIKEGAISMIPNLAPVVFAYGLLGWFDYPLDIGLAMTACIALGIAVDDTTHFMLRLQDLKKTIVVTPIAAIKITFHQCSRAMTATTLITGLGLSVFLLSSLAVMTRFAALLIALLAIALLCDLVLLPTLLKLFQPSSVGPPKAHDQSDEPQAKLD
jgi:uncharacterized protein